MEKVGGHSWQFENKSSGKVRSSFAFWEDVEQSHGWFEHSP